jgi:hypothetical protein
VAIVYNLYRTIKNVDVCIGSELLEVKVPIVFLGTVGFSPPREGRYCMHPDVSIGVNTLLVFFLSVSVSAWRFVAGIRYHYRSLVDAVPNHWLGACCQQSNIPVKLN